MAEAPSPQDHHVTVLERDHYKKQKLVKLEVYKCSDGVYDKPLSCFGCGIGWFSFLLGFVFPPLWYYATVLYFGDYNKDPRERPGLAASAIAALISSVVLVVVIASLFC